MGAQICRFRAVPAGTRYVIEGRGGLSICVISNFRTAGTSICRLIWSSARPPAAAACPKPAAKKNITAGGTTRKFGS